MGRSNQKTKTKTSRSDPDEMTALLEGMKLGQAVFAEDGDVVASFISATVLTEGASFQKVSIEKTLGEAFTGGRSTPVYFVQGQVHRPSNDDVIKHRSFCVKLVILPGDDQEATIHHKRESYAIERRFYDCAASQIISNRPINLTIPKLLASGRYGSRRPWPSMCVFS
jgi:hypothetical protein